MKIAVIGLGLVGGSLARDLARAGHHVIGHDRSAAAMRSARHARVLSGVLGRGYAGVEDCDAVIIAVPVNAAPRILAAARARLAGVPLITDVGSTKRSIVRAARRLGLGPQFVGAHPFAGHHRSGWRASRTGLFAGHRVFLTPAADSSARAVTLARRLWAAVGARPVILSPDEHDETLAWSSHLPQVAATALALTLAAAGLPRASLGPGGRDTTRIAASDPAVWSAILADNAGHAGRALRAYRARLALLDRAIVRRDATALRRLLRRAHAWAARGAV